jgi:Asp-tRNA(Asn)/Glu-tRNA(Gln) amidotransferase A subunit family amidase
MRGCCGPLTPLRALVTAILVGLLSIALPFVLQPLALDSAPSSGSGNVLGEGGYDIIPIDAPAASGTTLRLLAWLFARRSLSPLLARGLLNQNGVWKLRELAEQVPETVVQRHLPLHRLGAAEHAEHAALARGSSTRLALSPLRKIRESVDGPSATLAVSDVGHSSIEGMANSYEAGETTPTAVAQQVLKSIVTAQQLYGAIFVEVQPHTVMAQAEESTQRWEHGNPRSVFDGVPVAIKDMVEVRHHTMTDGSATADGSTPATQDDPIVAKLRAAGAIIVGTTVMTEFGVTPLGWSAHRQGPRNPRNKSHYPGGSSSGSAVAVALGIVPVAVGFDGGGSIRIPAALSGVYGLAAGFGRVHFKGKFGASSSMVHAGPLTNSARDLALTYLLLAQPLSYHCSDCAPSIETPHTTHSLYGGDAPAPHISLNPTVWSSGEDPDLSGVRLGVYRAHFDDATPPVRQALGQLEQELVDRGATIVDFSIPHMQALSVAHGMCASQR